MSDCAGVRDKRIATGCSLPDENIRYTSQSIGEFYRSNRVSWSQFYPSERWIFERIAGNTGGFGRILDVGCGAGGLATALRERFPFENYTGIDINLPAIEAGRERQQELGLGSCRFLVGDILASDLPIGGYDTVFSLSCADWNVLTGSILERCWTHVAPGGSLVVSLRLTPLQSRRTMRESYQYIHFGEALPADTTGLETAPYVVLNVREAFQMFAEQHPAPTEILAYGYWGAPSMTARTPFERICFTVFSLTKPKNESSPTGIECHLPCDLLFPADGA